VRCRAWPAAALLLCASCTTAAPNGIEPEDGEPELSTEDDGDVAADDDDVVSDDDDVVSDDDDVVSDDDEQVTDDGGHDGRTEVAVGTTARFGVRFHGSEPAVEDGVDGLHVHVEQLRSGALGGFAVRVTNEDDAVRSDVLVRLRLDHAGLFVRPEPGQTPSPERQQVAGHEAFVTGVTSSAGCSTAQQEPTVAVVTCDVGDLGADQEATVTVAVLDDLTLEGHVDLQVTAASGG
jgi:hypothetical protein